MDPKASHFGLNFAAAAVLPAQGFWNGLIYIVTTFPACKQWFGDIASAIRAPLACCFWAGGHRSLPDPKPAADGRKSVASIGSSVLPN